MILADLSLARRLEGAEGNASAMFAEARQRQQPSVGAEWIQRGGTYAIFDGPESPITQTFGLGIFSELTEETLDALEGFFQERRAPVQHEVCPLAGVPMLNLLCARGYRPIEISSVLYLPIGADTGGDGRVRLTGPSEASTWNRVNWQAWSAELPELEGFLSELGSVIFAREQGFCFWAEIEGQPVATAALSIHEGTALLAGAATMPKFRRQGLQGALLKERLRFAASKGCDLAMMVAEAGSGSQRNAERQGFRIAYTRTKWRLG